MSVWVMIASAVIISSSSRWQILVGRTLFCRYPRLKKQDKLNLCLRSQDIYLGMELAVIPVYQAEIVPAALRGYVVSTYQLALIVSILHLDDKQSRWASRRFPLTVTH